MTCKQILTDKQTELEKKFTSIEKSINLHIIVTTEDPATEIYINNKKKMASKLGVNVQLHRFETEIENNRLLVTCNQLNNDPNCHGYFIQLPLAEKLDKSTILEYIAPHKDVDCLTSCNLGKILVNPKESIKPATVEAIIQILKKNRIRIKGRNTVIINHSNLIGKPLANYLSGRDGTITICNEFTKDLSQYTKKADLIVTAVGKANLIDGSMIKKDAIVIDAGISRQNGKVVGDTDYDSIKKKAKLATPVPGGVGPLTVIFLLDNLYRLYKQNENK